MLQRLTKAALVAALACSIGLHWAFFQSVAWFGMVLSYSQHAPLAQALEKTFDGKHPCALCKEIAKGKRSEHKAEFAPELKKFEFLAAHGEFIFTAQAHWWLLTPLNGGLTSVSFAPPAPPPRGGLV